MSSKYYTQDTNDANHTMLEPLSQSNNDSTGGGGVSRRRDGNKHGTNHEVSK